MEKIQMENGRLKAILEKKEAAGAAFVDTVSVVYPYSDDLYAFGEDTAVSELVALIERMGLAVYGVGRGVNGYKNSLRLGKKGLGGFIAWGGESQNETIQLHLTGAGLDSCSAYALHELRTSIQKFGAKITRLDLALDILDKSVYSPEMALEDWKMGLFKKTVQPLAEMAGTGWLTPEGGKTLYIGSRKNGSRLTRVYDKAAEQGVKFEWTRVETQLRNRDIIIPVEALLEPGAYFAGLSKVHEKLVGMVKKRMKTKKRERMLVKSVISARRQFGLLINSLKTRFSAEQIVSVLSRSDKVSPYMEDIRVPVETDGFYSVLKAFTQNNMNIVDMSKYMRYHYITDKTL